MAQKLKALAPFPEGPEFGSQNPCLMDESQLPITRSRESDALFCSVHTQVVHTHTQIKRNLYKLKA